MKESLYIIILIIILGALGVWLSNGISINEVKEVANAGSAVVIDGIDNADWQDVEVVYVEEEA